MISLSDEQKNRLLQARSTEEVAALLHEAGVDVQLAERLWAELTHKREADSEELSPDELEAVSGGASARDYIRSGCAATVEPGSDCWGVDGGCVLVHYEYEHIVRNAAGRAMSKNPTIPFSRSTEGSPSAATATAAAKTYITTAGAFRSVVIDASKTVNQVLLCCVNREERAQCIFER